jgi:hypothetical protein
MEEITQAMVEVMGRLKPKEPTALEKLISAAQQAAAAPAQLGNEDRPSIDDVTPTTKKPSMLAVFAIDEDSIEKFGDLSQYNPMRRLCIRLSTNADFEVTVLLVILLNCVTLSLYRPLEPDDSPWNRMLFWAGGPCAWTCLLHYVAQLAVQLANI